MWRAMLCVCPESQRFLRRGLLVLGISVRWQVPLHIDPDGNASEAVVSYKVEAPVV